MSEGDLPLWATVPGTLLLVIGGLLALTGSIGLLRLPDFYSRMHPPTMGTTLGTGCVLFASMIVSSALTGHPVIHQLLITVFIVMTTPVTAMLLIRGAAYRRRRQGEAPPADCAAAGARPAGDFRVPVASSPTGQAPTG